MNEWEMNFLPSITQTMNRKAGGLLTLWLLRPFSTGWAAITKYHTLGGLCNKHLFLMVLEAGKSKIKVPADSVSGEGLLLGLPMGRLLALPSEGGVGGGERGDSGAPVVYTGPTLTTSSNPNCLTPKHHHIGGLGGTCIQCTAMPNSVVLGNLCI